MAEEVSPRPLGFVDRLGAALAQPDRALRNASLEDASGVTGTDAAVLLLLSFAVSGAAVVASALWSMVAGDPSGGAVSLATALTAHAKLDLVLLVCASGLLWVVSGPPRSLGRAFDRACVGYVPVAMCATAAAITRDAFGSGAAAWVGRAGYGWGAAVVLLAAWRSWRPDVGDLARTPPGRTLRVAGVGAVVFIAVALGLSAAAIARDPDRVRPVVAGDRAPDFSLPVIERGGELGEARRLSSLRGSVVVIDFWATWCGPCRASMPVIEDIRRRYAGRGVRVLSINTEGPGMAEEAHRMAERLGAASEQLSDDGRVANQFKVTTIPHMVVIDRHGVVRYVHRGFSTADRLREDLQAALDDVL